MIGNYLKASVRNFIRNKSTSVINLCGLTIGFTVVILIFVFVRHELSYDRFHVHRDAIYRIVQGNADEKDSYAGSPAPMGPLLRQHFPEIAEYTRLYQREQIVRAGNQRFREEKFFFADSSFFRMFTFPLVRGNPGDALKAPNAIIITEDIARKYFGEASPIGKMISLDSGFDFTVTGVAANAPENSHFHFDFLIPFERIEDVLGNNHLSSWGAWNYYTYFLLSPGTDPDKLEEKIIRWIRQDHSDRTGYFERLNLQPITEIHFKPNRRNLEPAFDKKYIHILVAVAVVILVIACINFANLSTARSVMRAKEVGLRKTVGASRNDLFRQFMMETVFLAVIACGMAVLLVMLLMPLFNLLLGRHLSIHFADASIFLFLPGLIFLTSLLAGIYPAVFLSSFRPASALKGKSGSQRNSVFQNSLVVFQFTVSIILIISTLVIYRQIHYIHANRVTTGKEQIVNINMQSKDMMMKSAALKAELVRNEHILGASVNTYMPSRFNENWGGIRWPGMEDDGRDHSLWIINADADFLKIFNIDLIEGEVSDYSQLPADQLSFVLNESALREMGWESAAGREMTYWDNRTAHIAGVVRDFHFRSLHHEIAPCAIVLRNLGTQVSLRIKSGDVPATLAGIRNVWKSFSPDVDFDYYFLDEDYDKLYRSELRISKILNVFAAVAIFIACIGLYGLTAFAVQRRMKELGVRKVLGATSAGLAGMFSVKYVKRVIVANLIGWPVAWVIMEKWLENFAYRIGMTVWIFLLSGCIALVIALLTVSGVVIRAAVVSPVESLRYE